MPLATIHCRRPFVACLCLPLLALVLLVLVGPGAAFAQDDTRPADLPDEGMLKWAFTEGMTLHFVFTTTHNSITSMKTSAEGAVMRLVGALVEGDEKLSNEAAELLKKGGKPVLDILQAYFDDEAKADERKLLKPIIDHLKANQEPEEKMPDRLIVAERAGNTSCAVFWEVEKTRGPRASVHVKTHNITVKAKQRTLGMEDYEHSQFVQGQSKIDPRTGQNLLMEEPDNPLALMFFHAMSLDYRFTIDLNNRDIAAFSFTNETEEAQRRARSEADPLQIGPSFRRLPGKVSKAGEKWETTFEYPDNDGTRVHVCEYELKEFALRQQRRCARIPWIERIYLRQPRAPFPGKAIGGGAGEFWIDIDHHVLVFHSQESAYETGTVLKTPKRGEPDKMLEMETFFTNVLKIEMRLSRITQK